MADSRLFRLIPSLRCPEVILPNSRMSAPAMNVRPAPIRMAARRASSRSSSSIAAAMPSGTPGLSAFTGGLSTVMIPMPACLVSLTSSAMITPCYFLHNGTAAVDCDRLPRNVARRVGGQEDRDALQLAAASDPAERRLLRDLGFAPSEHLLGHARREEPGRDRIDANVVVAPLGGELARERDQPTLGRDVTGR